MEYIIGTKLERYDRDGYVKPFFYDLPYSSRVEENCFGYDGKSVIDSKCFGIMFSFFYALSEPGETDIQLKIIVSDKKEKYKDYIELKQMHENYCSYEVHNLDNYKGERNISNSIGPVIDITHYYNIPNPKYIYLKKL